jgi:hypothetical protein
MQRGTGEMEVELRESEVELGELEVELRESEVELGELEVELGIWKWNWGTWMQVELGIWKWSLWRNLIRLGTGLLLNCLESGRIKTTWKVCKETDRATTRHFLNSK